VTRDDLVKIAMGAGLSYREARKAVSGIIKEMRDALLNGEDVDLPFGTIHPVKNKRSVRLWRFRKIVVQGKKKYRFLFRQKDPWT
jgi:nucleoid DNA-binding protein